jgi:hypothetical protein
MRVLILKHASKSRPTGKWSADDYDVVERDQHGEKLVGRIMRTPQAPQAKFRSFTFDVHRHRCVAHQRDNLQFAHFTSTISIQLAPFPTG